MGKILKKEAENEISHDLIIAVVNQGFSDELVSSAREAGASGGTVINARAQAHEGVVNFFGISVQSEKEVILMLVDREKKLSIMQVLSQTYGLKSKANGIVFSLPVDEVTQHILGKHTLEKNAKSINVLDKNAPAKTRKKIKWTSNE